MKKFYKELYGEKLNSDVCLEFAGNNKDQNEIQSLWQGISFAYRLQYFHHSKSSRKNMILLNVSAWKEAMQNKLLL